MYEHDLISFTVVSYAHIGLVVYICASVDFVVAKEESLEGLSCLLHSSCDVLSSNKSIHLYTWKSYYAANVS